MADRIGSALMWYRVKVVYVSRGVINSGKYLDVLAVSPGLAIAKVHDAVGECAVVERIEIAGTVEMFLGSMGITLEGYLGQTSGEEGN